MMLSFVLRLVSGEAMSVLLISKLVFSSIMIEELCFSLKTRLAQQRKQQFFEKFKLIWWNSLSLQCLLLGESQGGGPKMGRGIFGTDSSLRVKQRRCGKFFLLVLTKFSFSQGDWALSHHSMGFRHFPNISQLSNFLSRSATPNSQGNMYIPCL